MSMYNTGLRGDMAKRIMFSILPAVASTAQVIGTGGVIDYRALSVACNGRHDIIKYGCKACMQEIVFYQGDDPRKSTIKDLVKEDMWSEAIEIAVDLFSQHNKWNNSYGGKAWEAIARSIQNLIVFDAQLKNIRTSSPVDRLPETEVEVMKSIVMELNIFDGLSHNTDIVMRNLVELEHAEYNTKYPAKDDNEVRLRANIKHTNMSDIRNMMDSKELINPVDVFNQIENILVQNGDFIIFKDWIGQIRKDPSYRVVNTGIIEEKFWIRYRKSSLSYKLYISQYQDTLKKETSALQELMVGKPIFDNHAIDNHKSKTLDAVCSLKSSIANLETNVANLANEFEPVVVNRPKGSIQNKAISLNKKLYSLRKEISDNDAYYNDLWREVVIHKSKEPQALINFHNKILDNITAVLVLTEYDGQELSQAAPI
ncbi:MAG TPA: hypothetical protein VII94_05460 [Candidatus Saccharimonadales bacterium]